VHISRESLSIALVDRLQRYVQLLPEPLDFLVDGHGGGVQAGVVQY
jgi:hypothetical protein